ncbi:MAG: hypothetical protein ABR588_09970 [Sphingomicrobium sp.]|nr:hypothetical protein [Sphingomonadales bacterium]
MAVEPEGGQERVDAIQAQFRAEQPLPSPFAPHPSPPPPRPSIRRDPPPPDPALTPTDDPLRLRIAEELEYARRMVDALGDALCSDPAMVVRHTVSLQSIDIVGQMLGHLAAVTRSSLPERAVERIGMGDLKARLTRRPVV